MTNRDWSGLQEALADAIQGIRTEKSWSQDLLAVRAQRLGLKWKRATVADIEGKRRDLSIEEFILLPSLLETGLPELLQRMGPVRLGSVTVEPGASPTTPPSAPKRTERKQSLRRSAQWRTAELNLALIDIAAAAVEQHEAFELTISAQAELRAASALGIHPESVLDVSQRLWGRSLTEERERRMSERAGKGDPARVRGHITRQLIEEIREELGRPN